MGNSIIGVENYQTFATRGRSIYWELLEPEEGKFDFQLVDDLILEARKHNLKLVFLWFGEWKNSISKLWVLAHK